MLKRSFFCPSGQVLGGATISGKRNSWKSFNAASRASWVMSAVLFPVRWTIPGWTVDTVFVGGPGSGRAVVTPRRWWVSPPLRSWWRLSWRCLPVPFFGTPSSKYHRWPSTCPWPPLESRSSWSPDAEDDRKIETNAIIRSRKLFISVLLPNECGTGRADTTISNRAKRLPIINRPSHLVPTPYENRRFSVDILRLALSIRR